MMKINKRFNKLIILVVAMLMIIPVSANAEEDADITQLLKEFQVEDNPISDSIIMGNTNITGYGMDTLENALDTIFMEPAVSDYYDKICPLFEKSNISGIQMFIEGMQVDFSKYDNVYPVKVSGRVLVPLRAGGENLGAEVEWKAKEKLITLKLDNKVVEITVDSKTAKVNGNKTTLDVPAKLVDGRTLVPIRFISESFSKTVEWHPYNDDLGVVAIYQLEILYNVQFEATNKEKCIIKEFVYVYECTKQNFVCKMMGGILYNEKIFIKFYFNSNNNIIRF